MILLLACAAPTPIPGDSASPSHAERALTATQPTTLLGSATARANPDNPFSAFVTVTLNRPATITVEYTGDDRVRTTSEQVVPANTPTDILVLGLHADRAYTLRAVASTWSSEPIPWQTDPLPDGFPTCTATFSVDEATFDPDEVTCTNSVLSTGEHVYWCADPWGAPVSAMRTEADDSLMSLTPMPGGFVSTSNTNSKILFFDDAGKELSEYRVTWFNSRTEYTHDWIDNHEALPITTGAYAGDVAIITDATEWFDDGDHKLGNGIVVYDPITYAVDYEYSFHGELGDQVEMDPKVPYSRPGTGDDAYDWTHLNTIDHGADADGREFFLLSLKAQDWVVKLYPDTNELAWVLGREGDFQLVDDDGVPLPDVDWFFHQHSVRIVAVDGPRMRLRLYDNGAWRQDETGLRSDLEYSRAIELEVDEETHRARIVWAYGATDEASPDWMYSAICGSVTALPGGARLLTNVGDKGERRELSYPDGAERWRLTCDGIDVCEYRTRWYPSLYDLDWDSP